MTVYKWWDWQPQEKSVDDMTDQEYEQLFTMKWTWILCLIFAKMAAGPKVTKKS